MADKRQQFGRYGSLKTKTTSRCVLWCVQNFYGLSKELKNIRSDYFRVSTLPNCLFYLSAEFETNKNAVVVFINRCAYNSFANKLLHFDADITISIEDAHGALHLTKSFEMTPDISFVSSLYDLNTIYNFCITGNLHIQCTIALTESELTDSQKNCRRIQDKIWSHCSVISSTELKEHVTVLLEGDACNKVIISVDDENFPVHKNMLCSNSPVFSAMFNHDTLENQQNVVKVNDVRKEIIGEMLKFIYTGCTSALSPTMNMELFIAADKYAISSLKERCSNFLASSLNKDLVLDILVLAHQHADDKLKNTAIQFLTEKSPDLLKSGEFLSFIESECDITQSILLFLVKQNTK